MHERGMRAWRLVALLALLFAGLFPTVEVLDIGDATPENFLIDHSAATEGMRQGALSRRSRADSSPSSSPDTTRVSVPQRIPANMARADGRLTLIVTPRYRRGLQQAHPIHGGARKDSSTPDPA